MLPEKTSGKYHPLLFWLLGGIILIIHGCTRERRPEDYIGGTKYSLRVETGHALEMNTYQQIARLKELFRDHALKFQSIARPQGQKDDQGNIKRPANQILIRGIDYSEKAKMVAILDEHFSPDWEVEFPDNEIKLTLKPKVQKNLIHQCVEQVKVGLGVRLEAFGLDKQDVQRPDPNRSLLVLKVPPWVKDSERVLELLAMKKLEWKPVDKGPCHSKEEALMEYGGSLPDDLEILSTRKKKRTFYTVRRWPVVTGRDLKKARPAEDAYDRPAVGFTFNVDGARRFERYTAANIGKYLAVVMDGRIESVAIIQDVIRAEGILTGDYIVEEVNDLVIMLNSGALAAPVRVLSREIIQTAKNQAGN